MDWTAVKTFLIAAWVSISGPRLYLVAGLGAAACAIWLLLSGLERGVIASLRARLSLAEQRYRDFEREFAGRTPAQVGARFRQLEGYLASLPPRRLSDEQKRAIAEAGYPPLAASHLSILHDSISAETGRYARDLIEAFSAAHGWNLVDESYPMPSSCDQSGDRRRPWRSQRPDADRDVGAASLARGRDQP